LLVLAGSARFPGAALLSALAAARTGAGYVTLATPASVAPIAQAHLLSIPVIAAKERSEAGEGSGVFVPDALSAILAQVNHVDAVVCGPGLTASLDALDFAVQVARSVSVPLLLDADALRVVGMPAGANNPLHEIHPACASFDPFAESPESSFTQPASRLFVEDRETPLLLTPHGGELKRLLAATGANDAAELARHSNAVVVAKGPETLIVSPTRSHVSASATPALAKAGTGDVLSGIIGSLLAQGMEPFEAAVTGVELHSAAGRIAERRYGMRSVMAEDVVEAISEAIQQSD
jgi:NAD(P)H-hydrate epimerase